MTTRNESSSRVWSTGMPDSVRWLLLIYKVPSEPARLRATVWRRLKGLGAVYLQDGAAVLPDSAAAERALRTLRNEIIGFEGLGYLMRCDTLTGQDGVIAAYNQARDDEYQEIITRCDEFEAEIEREGAARHPTYAELEESGGDLAKLTNWLAKVRDRDVVSATGAAAAQAALGRCRSALERFAARVYDAERLT
jgi:hypothetical protein